MPFKKQAYLNFVKKFEKDLVRETYLEERHNDIGSGHEQGLNRLLKLKTN